MKNSTKEASFSARNGLILPFPCLMYTSLVSKWSESSAKKGKQNKNKFLISWCTALFDIVDTYRNLLSF